MAVRISELNALSVDLSQADELPIVDISAAETKKITVANILNYGISGSPSSFIDLSKLDQSSATKLSNNVLSDTGVASGTYGDAATVAQFAVNSKGIITAATGITIAITASSVTGLAPVATSGTYASLTGLPTLGTLSSQDAGSIVVSGGTISGVTFISGDVTISGGTISGITDLAVDDGGTGASTAEDARTNLGLAIGTDVQAYSSVLSGVAERYTAADEIIYSSASGVLASTTLSSFGRTIASGADAAAVRSSLGLGDIAVQNAGSVAISGGTISGITDLAIADGGTGASTASDARTNLGLAIGTDVQAYDAGLASIAGLSTSADELIYLTGADTYAVSSFPAYSRGLIASGNSAADTRTNLGLGSLAVLNLVGSGYIDNGVITSVNIASGSLTFDNYGSESVVTAAISGSAVTTEKIADNAITAAKIGDNSSTIVDNGAPTASGDFIGQQYIDTATYFEYTWDGDSWERQAAINSISFADSSPIAFTVSYPDNFSATITSSLDDQAVNSVFAGPSSGATGTPSFRALVSSDLPVATSVDKGAVYPGAGLSVDGTGEISHTNAAVAGTYTGSITIDAQGHIVSANAALAASDIPDLDASKITTGTFGSAFLADNSVTASQLADYGIAQVSESAPTPEFAGQWWINPNDRSAYIWVGEVAPVPNGYWLNLGYGSPTQINLRFGGTYNASGNIVESINSYGIEAGLTVGQALSAPNTSNNGVYLIVTASGTGTAPAPTESLSIGNWVLSQGVGASWTKVNLSSAVAGVGDQDVLVDGNALSPVASGVASQEDLNELVWARVQLATASTTGIVRGSSEVVVASGTGIMSIGTVDDGFYS
jgi:hypothetical protein